jgi:predicted GNAT family acetyltransferase
MTKWTFYTSPAEFLAAAESALQADPAGAAIIVSNAMKVSEAITAGEPEPDFPRWFAVGVGAGVVPAIAMRTAPFKPHPLWVMPMSDAAARSLAEALVSREESVAGVNGAAPAATVLAHRLAELVGGVVEEHVRLRQWEVSRILESPRRNSDPGKARLARQSDIDQLVVWWLAFKAEADEQAGRVPDEKETDERQQAVAAISRRLTFDGLWIWEHDGEPTSMVGHTLPANGMVNIAPVYTPPDRRGKGYAEALTATVASQLLASGQRVVLYTDQANPVSNAVYQRIGFQPLSDSVEMRLSPPLEPVNP